MTSSEKMEMLEQAVNYLERHSTLKWAHSFLKDLKRSNEIVRVLILTIVIVD
jgi:trehalose-6-phosphate synthase